MTSHPLLSLQSDWRTNQVEAFAALWCERNPHFCCLETELYRAYDAWARSIFCERMAKGAFTLALHGLGLRLASGGSRQWLGVRLDPDRAFNAQSPERVQEMEANLLSAAREERGVVQVELFLTECCEQIEAARERASKLYNAYLEWSERSGHPKVSQFLFGRGLRKLGFRGRKCDVRVWLGLRLASDERSRSQREG